MTNSSRETGVRKSGPDNVASPPKPGTQAPFAELSGTAGDATEVAPRQFTAGEVFEILTTAVAELESEGKTPTAAGVSARMRKIRPAFSPASTEFSSFRDITQAAEAAGLITATPAKSDFVLGLVQVDDFRGATLQPDLWRAIQDWTEGVTYAFSRATRKTEPVGAALPSGSVLVPTVNKQTTLAWLRDFAALQRGSVTALLAEILDEEDPVVTFFKVTRDNDGLKRRWSKYHRTRILETAVAWAAANAIPRSDIFGAGTPVQAAPAVFVSAKVEDSDARRRVLDILESMPLHELLRLPIPLEYSLKR